MEGLRYVISLPIKSLKIIFNLKCQVVNRENQKLRGMNGSRFFAYEIQTLSETSAKAQRSTESLPEIQRNTISSNENIEMKPY